MADTAPDGAANELDDDGMREFGDDSPVRPETGVPGDLPDGGEPFERLERLVISTPTRVTPTWVKERMDQFLAGDALPQDTNVSRVEFGAVRTGFGMFLRLPAAAARHLVNSARDWLPGVAGKGATVRLIVGHDSKVFVKGVPTYGTDQAIVDLLLGAFDGVHEVVLLRRNGRLTGQALLVCETPDWASAIVAAGCVNHKYGRASVTLTPVPSHRAGRTPNTQRTHTQAGARSGRGNADDSGSESDWQQVHHGRRSRAHAAAGPPRQPPQQRAQRPPTQWQQQGQRPPQQRPQAPPPPPAAAPQQPPPRMWGPPPGRAPAHAPGPARPPARTPAADAAAAAAAAAPPERRAPDAERPPSRETLEAAIAAAVKDALPSLIQSLIGMVNGLRTELQDVRALIRNLHPDRVDQYCGLVTPAGPPEKRPRPSAAPRTADATRATTATRAQAAAPASAAAAASAAVAASAATAAALAAAPAPPAAPAAGRTVSRSNSPVDMEQDAAANAVLPEGGPAATGAAGGK